MLGILVHVLVNVIKTVRMKNILKRYISVKSIIDDLVIKCDEIIDTPDIQVLIIVNSHC